MKVKLYAGIGSRETPKEILSVMFLAARQLARDGFWLRSGGARGADTAFERGARSVGRQFDLYKVEGGMVRREQRDDFTYVSEASLQEAEEIYRRANVPLRRGEDWWRLLVLRNVFQIMGEHPVSSPDPVKFVICWAPVVNGQPTGGTRYAIQVAGHLGIPVYNLWYQENRDRMEKYLKRADLPTILVGKRSQEGKGDAIHPTHRVYVGRPTVFGNPFYFEKAMGGWSACGMDFVTRKVETREEAVEYYRRFLNEQEATDSPVWGALLDLARKMKGETAAPWLLECWCAPKLCHAEVLRDKILEVIKKGLV